MSGLEQHVIGLSEETTLVVALVVAVLLGLRHATDPDHLVAVTTLLASGSDLTARGAGRLGASWGAGHATTLLALGVPIIFWHAYLPERIQQAAEASIGLIIVALAAWLLLRWRSGPLHAHAHARRTRSPLKAYAIGLVHGIGGSAGVGILLLATIDDHAVAAAALVLFAICAAFSMAVLSTGLAVTLARARVGDFVSRMTPLLGVASLSYGVWYALGALHVAPYPF